MGGRRPSLGVGALGDGLDADPGVLRLVHLQELHGAGRDIGGDGHRLVGAVAVVLDRLLDLRRGLADQRGDLADDGRVVEGRHRARAGALARGRWSTRTVSLRSTISPRGAATLTTRTWLRVTAAAYDFPSMICSDHSRRTRTRNSTRTTTPTTRRRRLGRDGSSSGEPDQRGDVDALAGPHARLARAPLVPRRAARLARRRLGMDAVSPEGVAQRPLHQRPLSVELADTNVRRFPSALRAHRMSRLTGKDQQRTRDGDDEEEGEEVDLHHLLLPEDGAEDGEQHVGGHAPDDRRHRPEPHGPAIDRRRRHADGETQEAAHQRAEAERCRQHQVEGQARPEADDGTGLRDPPAAPP